MLAVAPMVYCGECEFCIAGKYELCDNSRELAQHWKGGFAEFMAIPAEALRLGTIQKIPKGLDFKIAGIAEPISSCINAQEKANVGLGDTVVIIGSGPIGCVHTSLAKTRGAKKVIVADIFDDRLEMCREFGADILLNVSKVNIVDEVKKLTGGMGADVIITANIAIATAVSIIVKPERILLSFGLRVTSHHMYATLTRSN